MFNQDKFKSRLKLLRSTNNISTRALGDAIGVSHTAILQFEKGITLPAVDTLVALADYFDVSVDYLLGISDEPKLVPRLEDGQEHIALDEISGDQKVTDAKTEYKAGTKRGQADKKPDQDEIDKLIEELDEESVVELRKYAEYLKVRQTLDSNKDEKSAGLDGEKTKKGKKYPN